MERTSQTVSSSLKTVLFTQTVLTYLLSPVLQYLWGLINSLQIVVLFVLYSIPEFPINLKKILVKIAELVAFEFIDMKGYYQKIFGFAP